jgi:hypothetical protein
MHVLDLHPEKQLYMKRNLGSADRGARMLLSILFVSMILMDIIPAGAPALITWNFAAAMLLTSFISFSPCYALLGINSYMKHDVI